MNAGSKVALILAGHGSTQNSQSSLPTRRQAEEIARRGLFSEVRACFWLEQPRFKEVLSGVESREIFLVPNFICEGFYTREILPREFQLVGPITRQGERVLYYCDPVGLHPVMTDLLIRKAQEAVERLGAEAGETCLFIAGHGTPKNKNSTVEVYRQVGLIRERGLFAQVEAMFMEEEPLIKDWAEVAKGQRVVVVPFFIADGLHPAEDIPVMLGLEKKEDGSGFQRVLEREGKKLCYTSSIGTDLGMVEIILAQVEKFRRDHLTA
jgi:sirohydrochlorin cobaltochelatase